MAIAAPTSWWEWWAGLWSRPPDPGTREAWLEELRVGALLNKEAAKPPGGRDEERIHQLELLHIALKLANVKVDVRRLANDVHMLHRPATGRTCCAASEWVRQRSAASRQAVLDYYEQCAAQLKEQLAAKEAKRPAEVAVQPTLRLDLPEALQQQPPWLDICRACAKQLEENELAEESCRAHQSHLQEQFQAGAPAPAATSRGVAGATTAAADLPALEGQQQQQQQQQQRGGAHAAGSSDGAPITHNGQAAALPPQQHGSSDQEQEQWDAASERSLHLHKAR